MRLNYHRNSLRGWLGAVWNPAALWQELWWGAGLTLRGFYRQNSTGFVWLSGAQCWELAALHVLGGKGGIVGVVIKIHYWLAVLLLFGLVWNYFWSSEVPHAGTLGTALSCSWFSSYPTLFWDQWPNQISREGHGVFQEQCFTQELDVLAFWTRLQKWFFAAGRIRKRIVAQWNVLLTEKKPKTTHSRRGE